MSTSGSPWYRTRLGLSASALVFPPAGLVLLWMRPQTRLYWKLLGSVMVAGISLAHLFLFYGLRTEPDGTGMFPIFSFADPASHQRQLEQHRAAQKEVQPLERAEPVAVEASASPPAAPAASAYWADFRGPPPRSLRPATDSHPLAAARSAAALKNLLVEVMHRSPLRQDWHSPSNNAGIGKWLQPTMC